MKARKRKAVAAPPPRSSVQAELAAWVAHVRAHLEAFFDSSNRIVEEAIRPDSPVAEVADPYRLGQLRGYLESAAMTAAAINVHPGVAPLPDPLAVLPNSGAAS